MEAVVRVILEDSIRREIRPEVSVTPLLIESSGTTVGISGHRGHVPISTNLLLVVLRI